MNELAGELKAGKLSLPADARDAAYELHELALYLGVAKTPPCDEALYALADAAHPQHAVVLSRLRAYDLSPGDEAEWFMHPYCLKLLRSELDRTGPDGRAYTVEGDSVVVQSPAGRRAAAMPAALAKAADRSARAAGRQCDAAARLLGALVYGLPEHHPLLRDADRRLTAMRETLDRYPMRLLNGAECRMLHIASPHGVFAPDIRPLKRPATSDDVRAGRAVFHLTGKGRLAPGWKLPAVAAWRGEAAAIARRVIVVQAEIDRAGRVRCGIVAPHEVLAVDAGQLTRQTPQ